MNRNDIIRMARQAGMKACCGRTDKSGKHHPTVNALFSTVPVQWLEQFAALVAAEHQERYDELFSAYHEACADAAKAAAEHEACAKLCDEMQEHYASLKDAALLNGDVELSNASSGEPRACEYLAGAIRNLKGSENEDKA